MSYLHWGSLRSCGLPSTGLWHTLSIPFANPLGSLFWSFTTFNHSCFYCNNSHYWTLSYTTCVGYWTTDPWITRHCRFLVPCNTQTILTKIWHQFWDKNDGENIYHWNYFQIPWALSELPANWPGLTSLSDWIARILKIEEFSTN